MQDGRRETEDERRETQDKTTDEFHSMIVLPSFVFRLPSLVVPWIGHSNTSQHERLREVWMKRRHDRRTPWIDI